MDGDDTSATVAETSSATEVRFAQAAVEIVSDSLRNLITTGAGNPGSNPDEERYAAQARERGSA